MSTRIYLYEQNLQVRIGKVEILWIKEAEK